MELIYKVYYIVDLIADKKRNGAFAELFKDITEHINDYKNEIEEESLIELINNK